jgi:hypothetical protein
LLSEPPDDPVPTPRRDFLEFQTPITKSSFAAEPKPEAPSHGFALAGESPQRRSPAPERPPASQGSLFIRAAKEELTYSDFNQMVAEINRYNKHQQTREDTIANVQQLMGSAHRSLFEQFLPMIGGK